MMAERIVAGFGALAGLAGVALAAMAAHATGPGNLETASRFLMIHAPALLALAALLRGEIVHRWVGVLAAIALIGGLALFCGDLSVRAIWGIAPLRLAAPAGGVLLMLGWALAALAAVLPRR